MDITGELNRLAAIPRSEWIGAQGAANAWAGTTGLALVGALNAKAGTTGLDFAGVLRRLGADLAPNGALNSGADGTLGIQNTLRLPGISGNYMSTPDASNVSITGDIDIRVKVALDDWARTSQYFVYKRGSNTGYGFRRYSGAQNYLEFIWGSGSATAFVNSGAAVPFANGEAGWVRVTRVQSTGAIAFYTSTNGTDWTQRGSGSISSAGTAIADSTTDAFVGGTGGASEQLAGHVYYAEVRSGIAGPVVAKFDSATVAVRGDRLPTTHTQPSAAEAIRLPGVAGNYLSVADSAAIPSGVADIDLRIKCSVDSATGTYALVNKSQGSGQASWRFRYVSNTMELGLYTDGTNLVTSQASTALGVVAGTPIWLRVARVGSTGAATFYTSTDGSTWATISTNTGGAGNSIFDSTAPIEIGSRFAGGTDPLAGLVYEASVRSGIDGPVVASFDASRTVPTAQRLPATTSDGWTINGAAWQWQAPLSAPSDGTANRVPVPTPWTVSGTSWWWGVHSGSTRYQNYLQLPGTSGNYASTPDSAALSITGDIDIRVKVALDDWATGTNRDLVAKFNSGTSQRSYMLALNTSNQLAFYWSTNGIASNSLFGNSVAALPAGSSKWLRVTFAVATGTALFYTSDDGVTWTAAGTPAAAGATSIFDSTQALQISGKGDNIEHFAGKVYYVEIRSGIGGTVVGTFNPAVLKAPSGQSPTIWTDQAGQTWTVQGSAWSWGVEAV